MLLILPYSVVKMVMKEIRVGVSVLTETECFLLNKKFLRYFLKNLNLLKLLLNLSSYLNHRECSIDHLYPDRHRQAFKEDPRR